MGTFCNQETLLTSRDCPKQRTLLIKYMVLQDHIKCRFDCWFTIISYLPLTISTPYLAGLLLHIFTSLTNRTKVYLVKNNSHLFFQCNIWVHSFSQDATEFGAAMFYRFKTPSRGSELSAPVTWWRRRGLSLLAAIKLSCKRLKGYL